MSAVTAATHPCRLRLIAPARRDVTTPRIWFAVLTYNALAYTKRCLASLDLHTAVPWHCVVLDNTSTDGTRAWLDALDDPRITVELGSTNRGVAGGRNRLLELILTRVPDDGFVVFVDNDLEFFAGWLSPFLDLFARHPSVGMASCSGHEIVIHGDRRELLAYPWGATMPVDVASGGFACFARPQLFRDIGTYDEALNPFWHEDDDISVRASAAGWGVYAVGSSAVIHHGHKSGAALPDLAHGGSLSKQAYLVDKWRQMQLVDATGRLSVANTRPDAARAERLGTLLGRTVPLRRSEMERASLDIAMLQQSLNVRTDSTGPLSHASRYASAPGLALLRDDQMHVAYERVGPVIADTLARRRRSTRLPTAEIAHDGRARTRGHTRLADAADWDDPEWFACAERYAHDGRGQQNWYDRRLATWCATQPVVALRARGVLRPNARLLVVGDARSPVVWGLAQDVGSVVVADILDRYPGPRSDEQLEDPERFATHAVSRGHVRVVAMDRLAQMIDTGTCDAAVIAPWSELTTLGEIGALLSLTAPFVNRGAPLVSCVSTRLAGPPMADVLDAPASVSRWLQSIGQCLLEPLHLAMSDAGLLAATDSAARSWRVPNLLLADGAQLRGTLCVVSTNASEVPASPI